MRVGRGRSHLPEALRRRCMREGISTSFVTKSAGHCGRQQKLGSPARRSRTDTMSSVCWMNADEEAASTIKFAILSESSQ